MENRLKEQKIRNLIDMRKYKTDFDLHQGYCDAFNDFCRVTCVTVDNLNERMEAYFQKQGWAVADISEEKLQIVSVRFDKTSGHTLYGPTVLYTFGYRDKDKHRNFYMDNPSVDDTVRVMNDDQTEPIDSYPDSEALDKVIRNIEFTNFIEVTMMDYVDKFYYTKDNIYQFCNEMNRRGLDIPEMEFKYNGENNE